MLRPVEYGSNQRLAFASQSLTESLRNQATKGIGPGVFGLGTDCPMLHISMGLILLAQHHALKVLAGRIER